MGLRVGVAVGHSEAINAEFTAEMDAAKAMAIPADPKQAPGVVLIDGPSDDPDAVNIRKDPLERAYPVSWD